MQPVQLWCATMLPKGTCIERHHSGLQTGLAMMCTCCARPQSIARSLRPNLLHI